MFDGLLKSKFYAKCKSDIKMIRTRVDLIKKKRGAMQKYLRNDVADLLKNGLDINAYGRAEGLLAEMNRTYCYEFIEQCSVHVLSHLGAMNKQRECPEECREAVASLMFAAARFADLPELRELRTAFSDRYGTSLDLFVNKQFVDKLKSGPPSKDLKLQLLQEIATESGIQWNMKALDNKLYNAPAPQKDFDKETNDKGYGWHDIVDGSVQKKGSGRGYEFRNAKELVGPERKEDSHYGQKEAIHMDDRLTRKKETVAPVRDEIVPPVIRKPYEVAPVKDIQVDSNTRSEKKEKTSLRSVSPKKDEYEVKLPKYKSVPPPYAKYEVNNAEEDEEHEEKLLKYKSIPPPYTKRGSNKAESSLRDAISGKENEQDDPIRKAKRMPKSVRRGNHRPPPGQEKATDPEGEEKENAKDVKKEAGAEQAQRILKFFDQGKSVERDEEEKMMDKLLRHYSKKRDPHEKIKSGAILKPPPHHDQTPSSKGPKHRSRDGPNRASSLPTELSSPQETPVRHARANSFHPDGNNVHVHPKLPDYDDFVARLAALRGS